MIKAQATRHLSMSRQLSERQKHLESEAFATDEEKALQSGYLQAMAFDVARVTKRRSKIGCEALVRCCAPPGTKSRKIKPVSNVRYYVGLSIKGGATNMRGLAMTRILLKPAPRPALAGGLELLRHGPLR